MNKTNKAGQRFGGHFILIAIALIVFAGWRIGQAAGADESENGSVDASGEAVPTVAAEDGGVAATAVTTDTVDFTAGDVPVITDSSLVPAPNPFTYQGKLPEQVYQTYVVQRGDTPGTIAEKFGIETETLLGGNPQLSQESSLLQTDVELIILPVDGVLHDVAPGDTLESISEEYGIPVDDIIAYAPNNLEFPYRLYPETQIMVPGAVREVFVWTPPDLSSVGGTSYEGAGVVPRIVGTGTFIYPVNGRGFSQYYWYGHRAIDIALPEGNAVYASDTGTVTYASWNVYGYGNLIVINHGNGFETFYAHLSGINVVPGQIVYQGNVIGYTGDTGNSSGPHIHFEIRINGNQDNPCWYLGCG
ncbi:MAG: M23 family metallopeptidase [Ardenticatenaceae bacterium]|nr:M23 family metallopeptidase [Ardenticatenaceae bacterium]MCB9444820.1 M23 family metallopeptidase [Ardenticatenaceae bacterium]